MSIATEFQRAACLSRASLYGREEDGQMPMNLKADARVPFLGFSGPKYKPGGIVLLAINPGGGGDSYLSRTAEDCRLIPLIEKFVAAPSAEIELAFRGMCDQYLKMVQTWNLRRILVPTVESCGRRVEEVCYLNCFPYRTARDALPSSPALTSSWKHVIEPLIEVLQPGRIIALGKKAGNAASARYSGTAPMFVVPRTIGDTRISAEAQEVLARFRSGEA